MNKTKNTLKDHYYFTTTLPYVNAKPHCGHVLEMILADVIVRYRRSKHGKENTFFNFGTDEHGQKIYNKAKDAGKEPQEFVNDNVYHWKKYLEDFKISNDSFYRTSDPEHKKKVQKAWKLLQEKGLIYKKEYEGMYCVGCEAFKTEKDLVDGKCPDHQKPPTMFKEENYFLKLSAFADEVLSFVKNHSKFVQPKDKYNELLNFLKEGLKDISISRVKESMPWGIEVPDDPDQVMYVWLDALTNYAFAVGYMEDTERFKDYWPPVQMCGPDNTRFQGAIWQGILAALGLPFSEKILVHGMVLAEDGTKMSKSIGNVVDPYDLLEEFGVEAVRYYFSAGVTTFDDFPISRERIKSMYNDHLADRYGNLLNRVIHLANSKKVNLSDEENIDSEVKDKVDEANENFESAMQNYRLNEAYKYVAELTSYGNQFITQKEPWAEENNEKVNEILCSLAYLLRFATDKYLFILPEKSAKAVEMLDKQEKGVLFPKI